MKVAEEIPKVVKEKMKLKWVDEKDDEDRIRQMCNKRNSSTTAATDDTIQKRMIATTTTNTDIKPKKKLILAFKPRAPTVTTSK